MKRITPSEQRKMPWRNGGGSTSEIFVAPEATSLAAGVPFAFRVSAADVERDGPFSRFEGYDRHIVVVEGPGMTLDAGAHGVLSLDPLVPRSFSGDWDVTGTLRGGPVRDFNLIVDRSLAASSLEVWRATGPRRITPAHGETFVIHVLEGAFTLATAGDTLVVGEPCSLEPTPAAVALVGRVTPR